MDSEIYIYEELYHYFFIMLHFHTNKRINIPNKISRVYQPFNYSEIKTATAVLLVVANPCYVSFTRLIKQKIYNKNINLYQNITSY